MPTYIIKQPCNLAHAWCALCRPDIRVGAYARTAEISTKNSVAAIRRYQDPAERAKTGAANKDNPKVGAYERTSDHCAIQRKIGQRRWASLTREERATRTKNWTLAGRRATHSLAQNNCEKRLEKIIAPLGFRYVGDRVQLIGSKSPDFVHERLPVVVEFFGSYWHRTDTGRTRRDYFRRRGYRMVLIRGEAALDRPASIERRVTRALGG